MEYTEVVLLERIVAKSSTGRRFTFTFTPREDGVTDLGYTEEWHIGVPVVGRAMENLATRLGAGYIHKFFSTFSASVRAAVEGDGR